MVRLIFFIFLLLVCPFKVQAQSLDAFNDYAMASALKTMAKVYVQTTDLEGLKRRHLKSLSKMAEGKFQKRYATIYNVVGDIPLALRQRYGLKGQITKQEAIASLQRLDKKDIFDIIDGIPDQAIAAYVKSYVNQYFNSQQSLTHQNPLSSLDALWQQVLKKA